ncbi:hypothetical protein HBI56_140030 [Parastagonospora nodorum]|uniref:LRR-containing bacterial E3 ligase N-terminal domain-containing protein n=1 Tax=Phaeosphaeria nodorum (strain SN15 / ATCC MYA-4574 / FGSC 10173) TaxID=321614 RepID=A0A7U2I9G8_PHANO|nr:hypothetical protein HBH56_127760 [Parastagonospora nodorum]QRD05719.1 hypothetical protein JI435_422700 [Parastagonospora nodorum SN15]KAH3931438.1 hypothetical protein HBH54_095720 [Parastagonospora nodorum]KAH3947430.1 hypothetical protein HBH53_118050 [Parastagonospora nodorum]KAH3970514.1 hypothetical protein HBH51_114480 [Parastagonospora nodorum]
MSCTMSVRIMEHHLHVDLQTLDVARMSTISDNFTEETELKDSSNRTRDLQRKLRGNYNYRNGALSTVRYTKNTLEVARDTNFSHCRIPHVTSIDEISSSCTRDHHYHARWNRWEWEGSPLEGGYQRSDPCRRTDGTEIKHDRDRYGWPLVALLCLRHCVSVSSFSYCVRSRARTSFRAVMFHKRLLLPALFVTDHHVEHVSPSFTFCDRV